MAIYKCARHGLIKVEYLEIGEYGTFPPRTFCPGEGPAHPMLLEERPEPSAEEKTDEVP